MTISHRDATAADLEALLGLYRQLTPSDPVLDPLDAAPRLAALLRSEIATVLLAEAGDVPVATCILLIVPNLTRGGRAFAVVENVVTHAAHRRRGIGKGLLAEALRRAWAADCYKVMIATGRTDPAVLAFYEDAGFRRGTKTFFEARRLD